MNTSMKGFHHYYLGVLINILAFTMTTCNYTIAFILFVIGNIICLDDFVQHVMQIDDKDYRSPLHMLYAKYLWRYPIVQNITHFFDRLFGI